MSSNPTVCIYIRICFYPYVSPFYMMIYIYWSCLSFGTADNLLYTLFIFLNFISLPYCVISLPYQLMNLC